MKSIILILSLTLLGCSDKEVMRNVCPCGSREKIATFIQSSIKDSNNMSDEEMEDVIRELKITAIQIYCPLQKVKITYDNSVILTKVDSCAFIL